MLGPAARRSRHGTSLVRALFSPRVVSEDVAGSSRNWTSLASLYEAVKVRGAAGNGVLSEFRSGGRRTITNSRKVDAGVEAAAIPAGPVSKLSFVTWYLRKLDQRPLLTKSLTAGSIYTGSDLCSQGLSAYHAGDGETVGWDSFRSARMLAVGLFMSGPLLHLWFGRVGKLIPGRDVPSTMKKLVLGQVLFGPAFCAAFFAINAYAQGERGDQITTRLRRDLLPTLRNGLLYWPACDFVTYRYVPIPLQPLVSNSFSFLWTIYLTFMAGKKAAKTSPSTIDTETDSKESP